ncbi:MAG: aspartate aminotransferase family protein [Saprospiraceae bacterium]
MSLDLSTPEFRQLLQKATDLVIAQHADLDTKKGYHDYPQAEVESWFDEPLPLTGMPSDNLFAEAKTKVLDTATGNLGANMYAYVMAGGNQMSIAAEMLANTVNQNVAKWHLAPAMSEIEKRVAKWGAEMIDYPGKAGVMVSGGSAANFAGLNVGRNVFFERLDIRKKGLFGQKPFTVYASKETHSCVDKSLDALGIGTDQLRKIAITRDFKVKVAAMEAQIQADIAAGFQPFCIVGNAGTVNTGAIDDLTALADLAKKYKLWFHVDGAYGGLCAALDSVKALYRGIERADSVAMDFHKWLYQPFEAGLVLVKDWDTLQRTYFKQADYLDGSLEETSRTNFNEHYFQLSRNTKAFKVWMSLKFYGFERVKAMIQQDIDLAAYLAKQVEATSDFELSATSDLAICCFRYKGSLTDEQSITELNRRLVPALESDGRVFIAGTKLHGEFVLRACLINHRKTEATCDYLLEVVREVGSQLI